MTLLPEVRAELMATAARRATIGGRRFRKGFPHVELGRVAVLVGVCCALAVGAVALIGLGHQAPNLRTSSGGTTVSALESKLAILRRPQNSADRRWNRYLRPALPRNLPGYIPGLTRLAAVVNTQNAGRLSVVLFVQRFPDLLPRSRNAAPALNAVVIANGVLANSTSPLTAAALEQPGNVVSGLNLTERSLNPNIGISVGIVPDGVARVKWIFSGAGFGILHPRPVTVYAGVGNNVAIASVIPNEGPLLRASWYSAGGQLIASGSGGLGAGQQLRQIESVNASRNVPIAPLLLAHYSLFRAVAPDDPARDPYFATTVVGAVGGGQLNYLAARYIPSLTGIDGRGLWVIPGRDGICIEDPLAGVCGKLHPENASGFVGGSGTRGSEETLTGLVPDGNRTVTFVLASGARVTAPVVDYNVYEATVRGRAVAIIDRNAQGQVVRTQL